MTASFN